ncbi:hypothetical protein OROGR_028654 [Orobanche gracilis]
MVHSDVCVYGFPGSGRFLRPSSCGKRRKFPSDALPAMAHEIRVGSIIAGVVEDKTDSAIIVVTLNGRKGRISTQHLTDIHGKASWIRKALYTGYEFQELLVIGGVQDAILNLSAKKSLIKSASADADISQIRPNSVVHGYICNLTEQGCYVSFLGHHFGFAPRNKAIDDANTDILEAYCIGQSVRITNINIGTENLNLCLKQSSCFSNDSSFIEDFFLVDNENVEATVVALPSPETSWRLLLRIDELNA